MWVPCTFILWNMEAYGYWRNLHFDTIYLEYSLYSLTETLAYWSAIEFFFIVYTLLEPNDFGANQRHRSWFSKFNRLQLVRYWPNTPVNMITRTFSCVEPEHNGRSFAHDVFALQWRHNGLDGVSNHQPHHCLLSRLFGRRSKKTSKLRVIGLCVGNSPHKWPVTRKMFPFDDVIMKFFFLSENILLIPTSLGFVPCKSSAISTHKTHSCQVTWDISGRPIYFQWGYRKYPGLCDSYETRGVIFRVLIFVRTNALKETYETP